jgi:tRNA dimethylallyltransferase
MQIAIIGATATGKSDLAIKIAQKIGASILSLDSLSIYKEIDRASAKPSKDELNLVKHYGIDEIYPNEHFNVAKFFDIYNSIKDKNLIIVGGSSFYLKSMIDGLSIEPNYSTDTITKYNSLSKNNRLEIIKDLKLDITDTYRIEKAIKIYFETGLSIDRYFELNKKHNIINNIPIFEIIMDRDILRERIDKRTSKMVLSGLIDEVCYLDKKYTRQPNSMKAIGIREVLDYIDGKIDKKSMIENIILNTYHLAKRQMTFNRTQFQNVIRGNNIELEIAINKILQEDY